MSDENKNLTSIGEWIAQKLNVFTPNKAVFIQAIRHLPKGMLPGLSSDNTYIRQRSMGKFYESVVYECLFQLTDDSQFTLVRKGADVPYKDRVRARLGQEGLFYDKETGDIVIRGNGQDVAELDCLLVDNRGSLAIVETKITKSNMETLNDEICYKKRLLSHLFLAEPEFVLVCPFKEKPTIPALGNACNFCVITHWMAQLNSFVETAFPARKARDLATFSNLRTQPLEYCKTHDECRKEVLDALRENRRPILPANSWLVSKLVVGSIGDDGIKNFLREYNIIVRNELLTFDRYEKHFSRAVLGLSLPEMRPVIYLRLRSKIKYLKYGPLTPTKFAFERNIIRARTAFFDWLEESRLEIQSATITQFLHEFVRPGVVGSRRKVGELEELS